MRHLRFISPAVLVGLPLLAIGCREHVTLGTITSGLDGGANDGVSPPDGNGGDADGTTDGDGGLDNDGGRNVLWSATFEPGDLSEWTADGAGGAQVANVKIAPTVTTDFAHRGRFAGKLTLMPTVLGSTNDYLYREAPSPNDAFYSAWFYIPSSMTVKTWLSLVHFNGSPSGDGRGIHPTWDVNLYPTASRNLAAQLYNYVSMINLRRPVAIPVPRDTWVHFEVRLVKASTPTGRIEVWQDDVLILESPNVVTTENDWVQWNVGAVADGIEPEPAEVYIDDAAISVSRLGATPLP